MNPVCSDPLNISTGDVFAQEFLSDIKSRVHAYIFLTLSLSPSIYFMSSKNKRH